MVEIYYVVVSMFGSMKVSGVSILVLFYDFITRPTRSAQLPQLLDHWLSARIAPLRGAFGDRSRFSSRQ
ncbi:hypothetical protein [Pectobacterium aroidearum]|uniref:hypothetical protein n=1 Tax=Pectobacterium aroidearum TaxID=1201031 RepID=UPI0030061FE6